MPLELLGRDYPHTFGDGGGSVIDWSGFTGVWVCKTCGEQGGPYFDRVDTKLGATKHRQDSHGKISAEVLKQTTHKTCIDCEKPSIKTQGLCQKCSDIRIAAWLQENLFMSPDETLSEYRKSVELPVATSGRWAGHVRGSK